MGDCPWSTHMRLCAHACVLIQQLPTGWARRMRNVSASHGGEILKRSWTWNTKPYIRLSCCQFCAKACWLVLLKPMEHQRLNNSDVGVRCLKNKQGSRLTLRLLFKWLCHQWLWGKSPHVPFTTFCLSASLQTTATDVYLPMVFPMHILVLKSHAFCTKDFNFSCGVLVNVSNETRDLLLFSSLRLHRQLSCLFPIRQKKKRKFLWWSCF